MVCTIIAISSFNKKKKGKQPFQEEEYKKSQINQLKIVGETRVVGKERTSWTMFSFRDQMKMGDQNKDESTLHVIHNKVGSYAHHFYGIIHTQIKSPGGGVKQEESFNHEQP